LENIKNLGAMFTIEKCFLKCAKVVDYLNIFEKKPFNMLGAMGGKTKCLIHGAEPIVTNLTMLFRFF
jgi:hypothetical protein